MREKLRTPGELLLRIHRLLEDRTVEIKSTPRKIYDTKYQHPLSIAITAKRRGTLPLKARASKSVDAIAPGVPKRSQDRGKGTLSANPACMENASATIV